MDGPIFYFAAPSGHAPSGYPYIMHIHTYICGTYDSCERDGVNAHAKVSIESNVLRCREILGACRENHTLWQALLHEKVLFERKMKYITYRSWSIYYERSREQLATLENLSLSMIRGPRYFLLQDRRAILHTCLYIFWSRITHRCPHFNVVER